MQINVTYDASVSGAPAGFTTAVDAAVAFFESTFDADITVNITFGWGEVGGEPLDPGSLAENFTTYVSTPYVISAQTLFNTARSPAITDALVRLRMQQGRTTDWPDTIIFELPYTQARMIAQAPIFPGLQDGYIGLDSTASWTFDPNNRGVAGKYDAIGAIEHEISEVLGRQAFDGQRVSDDLASSFTLLDMFRYSASGIHTFTTDPGYFSLNGDQLLLPFNDPSNGGDAGDWSPAVSGDASDAFAETGIPLEVSAIDLRVLELLGYHLSPTAPTPNGTPVTPLVFTQNLQLSAGQTLNFDGPLALVMNAVNSVAPSLTNSATIIDTGVRSQTDVIGLTNGWNAGGLIGADQNSGAFTTTFQNTASGTLNVTATADAADAVGVYYGPKVDNAGQILVTSNKADAWGIFGVDFTNRNSGTLQVQAADYATGVNFLGQGGNFSNAGTINVTGLHATGVAGMTSFNNSGTLTVTGIGNGATSIAVYIAAPYGTSFTNSGLIQAQDAFLVDPFWLGAAFPNITITNSGTINGRITLPNSNNQIHNTGSIVGAIYFGDGNSIYDGAGGSQSGGIYLGHGTNTATLGNDGEAIYGGGGADSITGGSGNDFIQIARGANNINGGGGFNTLSLANSDIGVTVNLATGTLTGVGTSTIANIQQVVGSDFNDTLIAGSSAATLIGGGGQNTLTGGAANDTLVAGTGGDTATGNGGNDTFIYTAGDHQLVINDFLANGNSDVLNIYGYGSAVSVQQQGADTLITLSGGDSILLKNVLTSSLTGSNVIYSAAAYQEPTLPASLPVFGTTTIRFTYDLTIGAGETLNELNQHVGLVDVGGGSPGPDAFFHALDNFGTINVSTASGDVAGLTTDVSAIPQPGKNITNELGATFSVTNTGSGTARGLYTGFTPTVVNAGTFIVSAAGDAYGVDASYADARNLATGTITVSSSGHDAYGIRAENSAQIVNDGVIQVTGAQTAYGIRSDRFENSSIVNSGSITATGANSYGLYLRGVDTNAPKTVTNTGTITAQTAIKSVAFGEAAPSLTITNSGTIHGAIQLDDSDSQIHNTGSIVGAIYFGDGDSIYDGAGGSQSGGGIYLGHGNNTVTLGNDGETVYGGGNSDTITGGSGNDFIEIGRGTNVIDGGGGFNTLLLGNSAVGTTVNLATGTMSGAGTSTIANIQQVVGSNFNDTLIAGSTAATLIGGGGQNVLTGGAGNDTLVAGTGGDTETGNGGNDTFIYTAGDHQLVINDFLASGNADVLKIYGYGSASSIQQQGADTLITLSGSDTILLKNVLTSALTGSNVIYNAAAYQGPTLPASLSVYFGSDAPIYLDYDLTIYAGETVNIIAHTSDLNTNLNFGVMDVNSNISNPDGNRGRNFDNSGSVNITSADPDLCGLVLYLGFGGLVTNRAGASFAVSATAGDALGAQGFNVSNAGLWTVDALTAAVGIREIRGGSVVNATGGSLQVTSQTGDAYGLDLPDIGSSVVNDGTIAVSAAGASFGILAVPGPLVGVGFSQSSITNNGTISAVSSNPSSATYGIAVSSSYNQTNKSLIINTGTITAKTAIINADSGDGFVPLDVSNSGTINGDVDLGGSKSALTNSGIINGDVIFATVTHQSDSDPLFGIFPPSIINTNHITGNIRLADNDGTVTSSGTITGSIYLSDGNDVIDLRGGILSGAIEISPTISGKATHDDIFTGAAGGLISIHSGNANLTVTVTADVAGQTTVQFDIASTAASWGKNSSGSWTVTAGSDGTETLLNVSALQFTDRTVLLPANHTPVVTTANLTPYVGQTLALSSLISINDADGDPVIKYQLWDSTGDPNSGHFVVDGVAQPASTVIDVTAAQLAQTSFVVGAAGDSLQIRAFDGQGWSATSQPWSPFTITPHVNHAPVVMTSNLTIHVGQTAVLSSLFTVSDADGDPMTQYQLWDSTSDPNSGHFIINGQAQAAGAVINVTAAQLSQTSFVAGTVGDDLQIRAFDGALWSAADTAAWAPFKVAVADAQPVVSTVSQSKQHLHTYALSSLFTVSDGDGDTVTRYQLWDGTRDPNSGHFEINGVAQAAGTVIDITASQLAQTSFVTGTVGDDLQIRASDGILWSAADTAAWAPFTLSIPPNNPPSLSTASARAAGGQTLALSALMSVSDADGDTMTKYQLWDSTADPNSGHFVVNGQAKPAGTVIDITAAQLAQTSFVTGMVNDNLQIRAYDGSAWSAADTAAWAPFTIGPLVNNAPVVQTSDRSIARGVTTALSSLITVSDADSDAMTKYQLWDGGRDPNSGHFVINGVAQAAGSVIEITAAQLVQTSFVTGKIGDSLQIRAFDGISWSAADTAAWSPFTVSVPDAAPVVSTGNVSKAHFQTYALSSLFSVSDSDGDSMTKYQLWDSTRDPNSGHFEVNGVAQAAGTVIEISAAQLAQTTFVTGMVSDNLQIRAFDGITWSAADTASWAPFTVSVPANTAPVLTTQPVNAMHGRSLALSSLFSVSDADGDTMTRYQLWDSTRDPNSGHFVVNGVAQAAGTVIDITAAQLNQTSFVTGMVSDSLQIRAFDGMGWSDGDNAAWQPFTVTVATPYTAPVASTNDVNTTPGQSLALSSLFSVSDADGDTMTRYQLWDSTADPNSGHFMVNGVAQAASTVIDITTAQFAQTSFLTGTVGDSLQIRAFDGVSWTAADTAAWAPFHVNV